MINDTVNVKEAHLRAVRPDVVCDVFSRLYVVRDAWRICAPNRFIRERSTRERAQVFLRCL